MNPDLSRRQFLVHSASIAGASLAWNAARAEAGEPLRVGVVGLGDRGRHLASVLKKLALTDGVFVRITAVCDVDPRRLRQTLTTLDGSRREKTRSRRRDRVAATSPATSVAPGVRGYTDYRSLVTATDVDAVLIASPVHAHAEQAIAALAAGKHVYLEKPLATTPAECRQIRDAARRAADSGVAFQVGLQRRYNPCYQQSMRFVHGGEAGRVLFVRAQWHATGVPPKNKAWIFRRSLSGDMVVEQASHQFDVFNWLFRSPPLRACGLGGINRFASEPPSRDTMDHYSAIIEYEDDAKVHLSHLSYAVPERRFSGIYELAFAEKAGVDLAHGMVWTPSGENRNLVTARGNDTERAVLGFLECACTGAQPLADIEVGYRATLAALLCRRALETGRTVSWREIDPA